MQHSWGAPSLQDLAQGAASQQKLIDAAAAAGSAAEHAGVTQRQLKSLPAKLKQIQGEADRRGTACSRGCCSQC